MAIADLLFGDQVHAYNEATGEVELQEIDAIWAHYDAIALLTIDGEIIETTDDHPFFTEEGEYDALALCRMHFC